jgi:hypothetical protein
MINDFSNLPRIKDEQIIERDRQWFKRHVGRKNYCRLASELEEAEFRETIGDQRSCWMVIAVRRIASKMRMRKVIMIPIIDGRELVLPKDEETCAALFDTQVVCFTFIDDDQMTIDAAAECNSDETAAMYNQALEIAMAHPDACGGIN